jgi:antitoxin component YwqK of YwqJK toxin-antitoxin module
MRYSLITYLLPVFFYAKGQTMDFIVTDTTNVGKHRDTHYADGVYSIEGNYYLKTNEDRAGKVFRIFSDESRKQLIYYLRSASDGQIDTLKEWYEDGTTREIFYFKKKINARTCYEGKSFYRNGKLQNSQVWNADTATYLSYYPTGKLREKSKESINSGLFYTKKLYPNGQIMFKPFEVKKNVKRHEILYYENGKVQQDRYWIDGSLVDTFKEYYENGKLKVAGQYETEAEYRKKNKPGSDFTIESFKMGKWSYFTKTGMLEKEEIYDKNTITKTIPY